ncbi:hypothetical protein [Bacterioplanoides sp.]|uniref:hypothetical protein n=1 Tax=Bacterioplanoides sp. TaxID=2066072 RepID=UPI003AFFC67E
MKYVFSLIATLAILLAGYAVFWAIPQMQNHSAAIDDTASSNTALISGDVQIFSTESQANHQPLASLSQQELLQVLQQVERHLQQQGAVLQQQGVVLQQLQTTLNELQQNTAPTSHYEKEYAELLQGMPENFESRLKSDPQYAEQMRYELFTQATDVNQTDQQRVKAVQQLIFASHSIGLHDDYYNNRQVVSAMVQLSNDTPDQSMRIKALEQISSIGLQDPEMNKYFLDLVTNDDNAYVRTLSGHILSSSLYNSDIPKSQRQALGDDIKAFMVQGDATTQKILEQQFGSPERLQQWLDEIK